MFNGRINIAAGFMFLALFMLYGFMLIFLRDFAPGKEQWIADYAVGKHFESRLAHVHGNLFALINIAVGLVLLRLPLGILTEVLFAVPPLLVIVGGMSIVVAVAWLGIEVWRMGAI